jgi:hypothetical protein
MTISKRAVIAGGTAAAATVGLAVATGGLSLAPEAATAGGIAAAAAGRRAAASLLPLARKAVTSAGAAPARDGMNELRAALPQASRKALATLKPHAARIASDLGDQAVNAASEHFKAKFQNAMQAHIKAGQAKVLGEQGENAGPVRQAVADALGVVGQVTHDAAGQHIDQAAQGASAFLREQVAAQTPGLRA